MHEWALITESSIHPRDFSLGHFTTFLDHNISLGLYIEKDMASNRQYVYNREYTCVLKLNVMFDIPGFVDSVVNPKHSSILLVHCKHPEAREGKNQNLRSRTQRIRQSFRYAFTMSMGFGVWRGEWGKWHQSMLQRKMETVFCIVK